MACIDSDFPPPSTPPLLFPLPILPLPPRECQHYALYPSSLEPPLGVKMYIMSGILSVLCGPAIGKRRKEGRSRLRFMHVITTRRPPPSTPPSLRLPHAATPLLSVITVSVPVGALQGPDTAPSLVLPCTCRLRCPHRPHRDLTGCPSYITAAGVAVLRLYYCG